MADDNDDPTFDFADLTEMEEAENRRSNHILDSPNLLAGGRGKPGVGNIGREVLRKSIKMQKPELVFNANSMVFEKKPIPKGYAYDEVEMAFVPSEKQQNTPDHSFSTQNSKVQQILNNPNAARRKSAVVEINDLNEMRTSEEMLRNSTLECSNPMARIKLLQAPKAAPPPPPPPAPASPPLEVAADGGGVL